jgi:hypothetical protein
MPATSRDRNSYHNISVYNFGIESAEIANELALLRQFRDLYSIDQVIFYTGLLALPTKAWLQLSPPGRQRKPGFYLFGANKYQNPGFLVRFASGFPCRQAGGGRTKFICS